MNPRALENMGEGGKNLNLIPQPDHPLVEAVQVH